MQLVVLDRAAALAGEVAVRVVGEVDDRGLVGGGLVVDAPVAVPVERVGDLRPQRAGVAHLAVDARVVQVQADVGARGEALDVPHLLVEALGAAVQAVHAVVDGELVRLAVQGELALGDAVAVAADQWRRSRWFRRRSRRGCRSRGRRWRTGRAGRGSPGTGRCRRRRGPSAGCRRSPATSGRPWCRRRACRRVPSPASCLPWRRCPRSRHLRRLCVCRFHGAAPAR